MSARNSCRSLTLNRLERTRFINKGVTEPSMSFSVFFFQAEDGIRDLTVTGVQTCALPISTGGSGKGRNYGGGWTHTFSPNLVLDVRAGYAGRPGVDSSQQNQHAAGIDPLKQFGFGDIDKYGGLLIRLDTNEWTAGSNNDFGVRGSALRENPNWSVTPNVTWLRGSHNLKFGAWYIEAKRIQLNTFQRYTFSDEQTCRTRRSRRVPRLFVAERISLKGVWLNTLGLDVPGA